MVGARLGFFAATAVVVWQVWSIPGTSLWNTQGDQDGGVAFALVFWLAVSSVAYLMVQGSDPGYVADEALNEAEAESRGLLLGGKTDSGLAAAMVDDSDEDGGLAEGASAARLRRATVGAATSATATPGREVAAPRDGEAPAPAAGGTPALPGPARDAFGATRPRTASEERAMLAELGMTEAELSAAVDAEMAKHVGYSASWLDDEELEQAKPSAPPRPGLPVRAHFCSVSRRYVYRFDHYCGFLATPIGERNHCRFWWFLLAETCAIGTAVGITHSGFRVEPTVSAWWGANGGVFALALVLWLLFAFVGWMWLLHTWLAATNSTSFELLKGPRRVWYLRHTRMCDYPFSRGLLSNVRDFCFAYDGCCSAAYRQRWRARGWAVPDVVVRDSDDVVEHCWENKYWSCC